MSEETSEARERASECECAAPPARTRKVPSRRVLTVMPNDPALAPDSSPMKPAYLSTFTPKVLATISTAAVFVTTTTTATTTSSATTTTTLRQPNFPFTPPAVTHSLFSHTRTQQRMRTQAGTHTHTDRQIDTHAHAHARPQPPPACPHARGRVVQHRPAARELHVDEHGAQLLGEQPRVVCRVGAVEEAEVQVAPVPDLPAVRLRHERRARARHFVPWFHCFVLRGSWQQRA